jgi:DNA-binding CsgD family transcriptional regulator
MLGRVVHDGLFFQLDTDTGRYEDLEYGKGYQGPSLNYRKIEKLQLDPEYRLLIHHPVFERIARAVIEGSVAVYRVVLFNKAAHGGTVLPWHQDAGSEYSLTQREHDILALLAEGRSNREIAGRLYLSEKTVKAHLAAIFRKLGVTNRTQAAMMAVQMGVGPVPGALVNE